MGKASAESFKPHEVEQMARQQNRMNNPNVSNIFGTTTTEFGADDQADITQTLSPEMQAIIGSQMDFVSQGPSQLGQYQNPFLQGLMQGAGDNIARRWGVNPTAVGSFGGYNGSQPQFNANQPQEEVPTVPTGPVNPGGGGSGGGGPIDDSGREFRPIPGAGMGGAQSGFMGNGNPWGDMAQIPDHQLIQKPENKMMADRSQKGTISIGDRVGLSQQAKERASKLGSALRNIQWGS